MVAAISQTLLLFSHHLSPKLVSFFENPSTLRLHEHTDLSINPKPSLLYRKESFTLLSTSSSITSSTIFSSRYSMKPRVMLEHAARMCDRNIRIEIGSSQVNLRWTGIMKDNV